MIFALGCLQSLQCNTDECPTGVATQKKSRWSSLDVKDKSIRVANFHKRTLRSFMELVGALGLDNPENLDPSYIRRYTDVSTSKSYATIYPQLEQGELLREEAVGSYIDMWKLAKAENFYYI
jgi:hypothetical protein